MKEIYLDDLKNSKFYLFFPDGTQMKDNSKSPFVATNREIELDRLYGGICFKNKEEEEFYFSLPKEKRMDEAYRKKVAIEQLGYTEGDFNTEEYKKYANWNYDK